MLTPSFVFLKSNKIVSFFDNFKLARELRKKRKTVELGTWFRARARQSLMETKTRLLLNQFQGEAEDSLLLQKSEQNRKGDSKMRLSPNPFHTKSVTSRHSNVWAMILRNSITVSESLHSEVSLESQDESLAGIQKSETSWVCILLTTGISLISENKEKAAFLLNFFFEKSFFLSKNWTFLVLKFFLSVDFNRGGKQASDFYPFLSPKN